MFTPLIERVARHEDLTEDEAAGAMQQVMEERMVPFGQAGHAGDYEPIPLEEMATRYAGQGAAVS